MTPAVENCVAEDSCQPERGALVARVAARLPKSGSTLDRVSPIPHAAVHPRFSADPLIGTDRYRWVVSYAKDPRRLGRPAKTSD
jgi:hypothetical protein